ncbi:aminotransferase [Thioclava sp. SK-1]|uniref:MalY/PatB family protein n=1 Tax=Thioclava sp. SK-1 TaxID=1889770 RepID=UPI0008253E8D|nr:MalY/PatB family protein [Thioclava sp. SK-1]OCX60419.1 aminotransferase [Thioclava sp. SK-1]
MTQSPDFDELIDRTGTHSAKWDAMESIYGVSAEDGIAMWVADMDFRPPACVQQALEGMAQHGVYGYWGDNTAYHDAIVWWMKHRHNWVIDPEWIFTTHGLVNGTAMCVDTWTDPGDGVMLMTPVYHAFARVVRSNGRRVVECPLKLVDGQYQMDFDLWDGLIDDRTKMLILCSPHNPGGRVWTTQELRDVAAFAKKHDLVLVSDEIHHDLVLPGAQHTAFPVACPDHPVVMLTATTKTFNIAGCHSGNVIIRDLKLRKSFGAKMAALGISPNSFGLAMATAAYSPEGATWVDALVAYLDENRRIFDAAVNALPGLKSMPMQATYLAWVDFSGTGMAPEEFTRRVEQGAKIAANHGDTFGLGGETFMRFNIATPRARIHDAVARLQAAFADLQ